MKMNKDYFFVPYDAILPNSWQKIYRNPSQCDDVPNDANTVIGDVRLLFDFARIFIDNARKLFNTTLTLPDMHSFTWFSPFQSPYIFLTSLCASSTIRQS